MQNNTIAQSLMFHASQKDGFWAAPASQLILYDTFKSPQGIMFCAYRRGCVTFDCGVNILSNERCHLPMSRKGMTKV